MNVKPLSVLAAAGGTLIVAGPVQADFTGIRTESKPNSYGLLVCNVFATFDRPGGDLFLSVAEEIGSPLIITVIGGTFYQHPSGTDKAPNAKLVEIFPTLAYDSFVTIGVKKVGEPGGQPNDALVMTPGWPGFGPSVLGGPHVSIGWAVTPSDLQADPFNPAYAAGNGQVLIGQYSTLHGTGIVGQFRILVVSNGVPSQLNVSFSHFVPGPGAIALLAIAGGARRRRRG